MLRNMETKVIVICTICNKEIETTQETLDTHRLITEDIAKEKRHTIHSTDIICRDCVPKYMAAKEAEGEDVRDLSIH